MKNTHLLERQINQNLKNRIKEKMRQKQKEVESNLRKKKALKHKDPNKDTDSTTIKNSQKDSSQIEKKNRNTGSDRHSKSDASKSGLNASPAHDKKGKFLPGNSYRWAPGHIGTSPGRPPKSILDQAIEDELALMVKTSKRDPKTGKRIKKQKARLIAKALLQQLILGKRGIAQLVAERTGGKPLQQIEAKVEAVNSDPEYRKARIQQLLKKAEGSPF
jgi:hypothetical protein